MAEDVLEPEFEGIIRNTLIEDLSKILYTYSNDGEILKELIQNAEDAGADKIAILYDERNSNLNAKRIKQDLSYSKYFEGPALIVYNNEEFSEADWKGIRRIGTSIKKLDPSKVGRFGLGFKSVFHITATPEMVVQFAKEIAEKGLNLLSGETSGKSKLLGNHLFNREELLDELKCTPLRDVKYVRFIEPFQLDLTDQLSRIHKQYQNRVLVSFEDCTLYGDDILPLVWTSAYVLPDYVSCNSEKTKEALTLLGVDVLPKIEVVVQNLKTVAVSVQDKCSNDSEFVTEDKALFLKDLFFKHYICLQKSDITNTCLLDLKTTPIVFFNEEKVCLLCEQVVLLLQDHEIIQPYLMRIPTDYMYCANLFRKLGALETTSSFHFADVLLCLHRDSLDGNSQPSILGPNEKKIFLFLLFKTCFQNHI
ncbi:unnamed protein product [Mytilus coruscus]|uniref:Sacsin/Nov domain-containing protein n=1 Tax=Mytilus coruscus TaxID=42192 RepID=A0A6J8BST4_MYTCO|nr:unnamed protein product [Mytilus coruscus]